MSKNTVLSLIAIFALVIISSLVYFSYSKTVPATEDTIIFSSSTPAFKIGDSEFKEIEIRNTLEERKRGLSGRTEIGEDYGMVFIFEKPDRYGFWMKDMNFPIDIIWIDENCKVVDLTENLSEKTYPKNFYPQSKVKYVIETKSGTISNKKIRLGEKLISSHMAECSN